jgi:hypothetical protein
MVIKPSAIFSDCGLAINIDEAHHPNAEKILEKNGITEIASYIKSGKEWISYGG